MAPLECGVVAEWLDLRMLAQMNARTACISAGFAGLLVLTTAPALAQLRGHGGPVRALAISPDGTAALSGSFDSSAIRWSLARNAAEQVLRFHDDAVNAVALLRDGRAVTAGGRGGRPASCARAAPPAHP